jgi:hypothetical protein
MVRIPEISKALGVSRIYIAVSTVGFVRMMGVDDEHSPKTNLIVATV